MRAALAYLLEEGEAEAALHMAAAFAQFWWVLSYLSEGRQWIECALAASDAPTPLRALAFAGASNLALD